MSLSSSDRLSASDNQKIAATVESAFKQAMAGGDPSEIMAKVATKDRLTRNQTKRACEAFNVTRTLHHYKTASTAEKPGTFPIVDPVRVEALMFPKEVTKAAMMEDVADDAYDLDGFSEGVVDQIDFPASIDLPEVSTDVIRKKVAAVINRGQVLLASLQDSYSNATVAAEGAVRKIASCTSGLYGDSANSINDEGLRTCVKGFLNKAASDKPASTPSPELTDLLGQTQCAIKIAAYLGNVVDLVSEELSALTKEADTIDNVTSLGAQVLRPFGLGSITDPAVDTLVINPALSGKNLKRTIDSFDYNPYNDPMFHDVVKTREILKNAITLSDLIKSDEVLSKADPRHVTDSFNSIFSTNPGLFDNPELAKSALRYAVEYGGMDFQTMIKLMEDGNKMPTPLQTIPLRAAEYAAKAQDRKTKFIEPIVAHQKSVKDQLSAERTKRKGAWDSLAKVMNERGATKKDDARDNQAESLQKLREEIEQLKKAKPPIRGGGASDQLLPPRPKSR